MTLSIPAKVLIHLWSYDFYDMTLSTGKERRHMEPKIMTVIYIVQKGSRYKRSKVTAINI